MLSRLRTRVRKTHLVNKFKKEKQRMSRKRTKVDMEKSKDKELRTEAIITEEPIINRSARLR